jgi:gas vesicle protein
MTTAIDNAMGTAKGAIGNATHVAKDVAGDAAEAVKGTADDAAKTAKKVISFLRYMDIDDVLGVVGLRRNRTNPLAVAALIGGGMLVGAGVAFLMTPVSGRDARRQNRNFLETMTGRAREEADRLAGEVKEKATEVAGEAKDKVSEVKEKVTEAVGQMGETEGAAQADEGTDERKGRRRNHQAQVS